MTTPSVPDSAAFADKTFELVMQCCQPSSYPGTSAASAVYEDVRNAVKETFEAFGRTQYERGVMTAAKNLREQFNAGVEVGFKDGIEKAAGWVFEHGGTCESIAKGIRAILPPSEGAK